jgi:hypothetical protein
MSNLDRIGAVRTNAPLPGPADEQRWKGIVAAKLQGLWWGKFLSWSGGLVSEGQVAGFAIQQMNSASKEWNLAR